MVVNGDIITLSKREIKDIIEKECQKRLSISYKEFLEKRKQNELLESMAVHDIELLLKFANQ